MSLSVSLCLSLSLSAFLLLSLSLHTRLHAHRVPASVFRYYFYEKWAAQYTENSFIMFADFRDIFFQADPFLYHRWNNLINAIDCGGTYMCLCVRAFVFV